VPSDLRIGVLVSGTGTTLQALIDACLSGVIPGTIAVVVSNTPNALALERARKAGIPAVTLDHRLSPSPAAFEERLRDILERAGVELVCLAGFLRILSPVFVRAFAGRIMNIHPALLPAFGGKGMYGERVHEAVLASGARLSGCTVHFVTEVPDGGPIIAQTAVPVLDDDTPASLAARVRCEEHRLYPAAVRQFALGRLRIEGRRVFVAAEEPHTDAASGRGPFAASLPPEQASFLGGSGRVP
jgi:phosphoribosylglycinamide formyltransferase 1